MKWAWPAVVALMIVTAIIPMPAAAQSGVIQISPDMVGPGTKLTAQIVDGRLDASANRMDEYEVDDIELVTFATDRGEVDEAVPDIEETGQNTGIFTFELQLVTDAEACDEDDLGDDEFRAQGGSDPRIGVCPGDILSIEYEDPFGNDVFSSSVEIQSWDPEFEADQGGYSPGDRVTIDIADPDANRDPDTVDSIRDIRVNSDDDPVGEELSAIEIGEDTGVFRLSFQTSTTSQSNAILVKQDADVRVEYTDEFPADFADTTPEKTFTFSFIVTSGDGIESLTLSAPKIVTDGSPATGKQAILSTEVRNNEGEAQPFAGLVEVRDLDGVTVFLAWQSGTLDPNDQKEIGVSWMPERPGDYTVRTFAVDSLEDPHVLSTIAESTFTVE